MTTKRSVDMKRNEKDNRMACVGSYSNRDFDRVRNHQQWRYNNYHDCGSGGRNIFLGAKCDPEMKRSIYKTTDLSPRHVQVLTLISNGLTDAEIGDKLGISPHTVKGFVRVIMDRLRAKSRSHAVGIWLG